MSSYPGAGPSEAELEADRAAAIAAENLAARAAHAAAEAGAEPQDGSERPRRDKPPRARTKRAKGQRGSADGKPRGAVKKQQSAKLERALAEVLTFPAVPAGMFAPDQETQAYMIEHFTRSGPRFAGVLVEASETNEQLRELLERITTGGSMFAVVLAGAAYLAPPVLWAMGGRERAMSITLATTMDAEQAARMMGAYGPPPAAHEPPQPAEHPGAEGAEPGPAAPAADPQHG